MRWIVAAALVACSSSPPQARTTVVVHDAVGRAEIRVGATIADVAAPVGAFLPDGRWLTVEDGGVVAMWSATGLLERSFRIDVREVERLAVDPRGGRIAVEAVDRSNGHQTLTIVAVATGNVVRRLPGGTWFRFLPDGKLLVLADYTLDEIDVDTGNVVTHYDGTDVYDHGGILVSPNGRVFAAPATASNKLAVWERGAPAQRLVAPGGRWVHEVLALTDDREMVVACASWPSCKSDAALMSIDTGATVVHYRGVRATSVAIAEGGQRLAFGLQDTVLVTDRKGKRLVEIATGGAVAFDPTGRTLAITPQKSTHVGWYPVDDPPTSLWNAATGRRLDDRDGAPRAIAFAPDGAHLAIGTLAGAVELDLATGAGVRRGTVPVAALAYAPDGLLVFGNGGLEVHAGGTTRARLDDLDGAIWAAPAGADAYYLGGRFPRMGVVGRDGKSRGDVQVFEAERPPHFLALPDGVAVAHNEEVTAWKPGADAVELAALDEHAGAIAAHADQLAVGDDIGRISLWNIATQTATRVFAVGSGPITALAYAPAGDVLAVAGWLDTGLALWDPRSGARLATLDGQTAPATAIAFSPDGRLVAAASRDAGVRLWSVATGALLATIRATTAGWAIVAPDARFDGSADLPLRAPLPDAAARTAGLLARVAADAPAEHRPRAGLPGAAPAPDPAPATCVAREAGPFGHVAVHGARVDFCVAGARRTCWSLDAANAAVERRPLAPLFAANVHAPPPAGDITASETSPNGKLVADNDGDVEVRDHATNKRVLRIEHDDEPALHEAQGSAHVYMLDRTLVVAASVCAGPCTITSLWDVPTKKKVGEVPSFFEGNHPILRRARGDLWWFQSDPTGSEKDEHYEYLLVDVRTGKVVRRVPADRPGALTSAGIVLWPATASDPIRVVDDRGKVVRSLTLPRC